MNKKPDDICQFEIEIKDKKFGSQFIRCGHKRSEHRKDGNCNSYVIDPIWKDRNYCFCDGFVEKDLEHDKHEQEKKR